MSEAGAGAAPGAEREPLGSAAEEAARLLDALSAWATGALGAPGSAFASAREHLHAEGLATGAPECQLCPVCRLISTARGMRPEVAEHLLDAGGSLLAALRAGLAAPPAPGAERPPEPPAHGRVEHIDVD